MKNKKRESKNNVNGNNQKITGKIILLVLLSLIMPTMAGVFIGVNEITNQTAIYLIQFVFIFIGCLVLIGIIKKSTFEAKKLGFVSGRPGGWIIAAIAIEATAFIAGFNQELDIKTVGALVIFMISVGFFEEIIYRGLILQYLMKKNAKRAILLSAFLFGAGHIVNLLGGKNLEMTIVQIIFAVLFGIVCAEIVLLTQSIILVIIWHSSHNIISSLTASASIGMELAIVSVQCIILLIIGFILWKKVKE